MGIDKKKAIAEALEAGVVGRLEGEDLNDAILCLQDRSVEQINAITEAHKAGVFGRIFDWNLGSVISYLSAGSVEQINAITEAHKAGVFGKLNGKELSDEILSLLNYPVESINLITESYKAGISDYIDYKQIKSSATFGQHNELLQARVVKAIELTRDIIALNKKDLSEKDLSELVKETFQGDNSVAANLIVDAQIKQLSKPTRTYLASKAAGK